MYRGLVNEVDDKGFNYGITVVLGGEGKEMEARHHKL